MVAEEEVAYRGTDEHGGAEEIAPFGDADQANDQNPDDDNEPGGVAVQTPAPNLPYGTTSIGWRSSFVGGTT